MQEYNFTFELYTSVPTQNAYVIMTKKTMLFCDFTMGKYSDPILKLIYDEFKLRGAEFLSRCPTPTVSNEIKDYWKANNLHVWSYKFI